MEARDIAGCTRVIGESQGYYRLPIRDEMLDEDTPMMTSAWYPTLEEMKNIVRGAPIYLQMLGESHPPVMIITGEPVLTVQ